MELATTVCSATRTYPLLAAIAVGAVPYSTAASEPPAASTHKKADPTPIIGGRVAEVCEWPSTVAVENRSSTCTASLVHPRLIITAAHCGAMTEVNFGER